MKKLFSIVALFFGLVAATCTNGPVNPDPVDPVVPPVPDVTVTVENTCQHMLDMKCVTVLDECVEPLNDMLDAGIDPELSCIYNAGSCDEAEACR